MKDENIYADGKNYDFALDNFKGICELNNYNFVRVSSLGESIFKDTSMNDLAKMISENGPGECVKYYTYGARLDSNKENIQFETGYIGKSTVYTDSELINIGIKYAEILGVKNAKVQFDNIDSNYEGLLKETLESVEIECDRMSGINDEVLLHLETDDKKLDKQITFGYLYRFIKDGITGTILSLDYNSIDEIMQKLNLGAKNVPLDIYVIPTNEKAYSDAFVVSTMLKDAGYKVEVDYRDVSSKEKQKRAEYLNSAYIITVSDEYSAGYQVRLKDTITGDENMVDINNLVDWLDMKF